MGIGALGRGTSPARAKASSPLATWITWSFDFRSTDPVSVAMASDVPVERTLKRASRASATAPFSSFSMRRTRLPSGL